MKLTNKKLTASLSLVFGVILAGGFLLAHVTPQPQNPVFANPQPGQGGFQIPGRAKMGITTAPASNSTGLISDPTGACFAQNYGTLLFNPFTRDLSGCVPVPGLNSGNSLSGQMNYAVIAGGQGFVNGLGASLTGATIAPTFKLAHFTGTTALVTITAPTGITSGASFTLIFDGSASGLTWTAAGNIAVGGTSTTALSTVTFIYDAVTAKFYPSRLA